MYTGPFRCVTKELETFWDRSGSYSGYKKNPKFSRLMRGSSCNFYVGNFCYPLNAKMFQFWDTKKLSLVCPNCIGPLTGSGVKTK